MAPRPSHTILSGLCLLLLIGNIGCALRPTAILTPEPSKPLVVCEPEEESLALLPKRVAVLHFPVEDNHFSHDLPGLGEFMADSFVQAMKNSEQFIVEDATHIDLSPRAISPLGQSETNPSAQIKEIARQFDSQLVLRGRVLSLQHTPSQTGIDALFTQQRREIILEMEIYDGFSGTLFQRERLQRTILGGPEPSTPMDLKQRLFESEMGQATQQLLDEQVTRTTQLSRCLPLGGRILAIDNEIVTINLGAASQIKPGDIFKVFNSQLLHHAPLGHPIAVQSVAATVEITRVQPTLSQGRWTAVNSEVILPLHSGDYLLGW